ncbi:MAG: hypothetical protein AABX47_06435 [Nanoarchaeota archaeon]
MGKQNSVGRDNIEYRIQNVYASLLRINDWIAFGILREETAIKPDREITLQIHQKYARYLDFDQDLKGSNNLEERLRELNAWHETTRIKPATATIEAKYSVLLHNHDFGTLIALYNSTNVRPRFASEDRQRLQKEYTMLLGNDWFDELRELQRVTGIKPDRRIVQREYNRMAREGDSSSIKTIAGITHITPELSETSVQKGYATILLHLNRGNYRQNYFSCSLDRRRLKRDIRRFRRITGIDPTEEFLQEVYPLFAKEDLTIDPR